jgi:hypothetical protein
MEASATPLQTPRNPTSILSKLFTTHEQPGPQNTPSNVRILQMPS